MQKALPSRNPPLKVFLLAGRHESELSRGEQCGASEHRRIAAQRSRSETDIRRHALERFDLAVIRFRIACRGTGALFPSPVGPVGDALPTDEAGSTRLDFEPFWNELAANGVKTIVFDATSVPVHATDPGIQVIDWNTQCNVAVQTNREDVLRQLKRRFGAGRSRTRFP